jgi:hypothetical protein
MTTTPTKNERDEGKSISVTPDTHDGSFDDDGNDSDEECPFDEIQPRLRLGSVTTAIPRTTTTTPAITHEEKVLGIAARDVWSASSEDYHIRRPSSSSSDDASLSTEYSEGSRFCSFVVRTGTGIVCSLSVVLVILVVLFVSNKNDKNSEVGSNAALGGGTSSSPAMPNVLAPSSASLFETKAPSSMAPADPFWDSPAMSPSSVDRKTNLVDFLKQATATGTFNLNFETEDPTSRPNQLAIEWLLEDHAANTEDLDDQLVYDQKLIQRFALVALDFAMTAGRGGGGDPPPFFATETTSNTVETNVGGPTTWSTHAKDECAWFGIVCNGTVVTELNWARLGLTGSIPDSVAVLSDLTQIDFSNNALVGPIPESLYGLTELMSIYFYKNNLTGTLSDGIGNLKNLVHLMLNENDLAGPFPTTLRSSDSYFPPIGKDGWAGMDDTIRKKRIIHFHSTIFFLPARVSESVQELFYRDPSRQYGTPIPVLNGSWIQPLHRYSAVGP